MSIATSEIKYVHVSPDGFVMVVRLWTKDGYSWKEASAYNSLSEASYFTKTEITELERLRR